MVSEAEAGARLDVWLAGRLEGLSRHQIQLRIKREAVRVDGSLRAARYRLKSGERVEVDYEPAPEPEPLVALDLDLTLAHDDEELCIVDKPSGLVVHPGAGHEQDTLANALIARFGRSIENVGGPGRCGIVHRLDKLTSGLLLVAKNQSAHETLTRALAEREIQRRYLGIAMGQFAHSSGKIERPIGRRPGDRKRMGVERGGRPAETSYRVLSQGEGLALLLIRLQTGRTHQIRVHMQSIGRPIAGDAVYGWTKRHCLQTLGSDLRSRLGPNWPQRQMLHATGLGLRHPVTGKLVRALSSPPQDMTSFMALALGEEAGRPMEAVQRDLD